MDDTTRRQGEAITNAIRDFRVQNWLDGSTKKADHITRAELHECGYAVMFVHATDDADIHPVAEIMRRDGVDEREAIRRRVDQLYREANAAAREAYDARLSRVLREREQLAELGFDKGKQEADLDG